jgi:hypothetical protein
VEIEFMWEVCLTLIKINRATVLLKHPIKENKINIKLLQ